MDVTDRLKTSTAFADISRRWTTVMDAKAAFLSALNAGMLAFLWASARLVEHPGAAKLFAVCSTFVAMLALMCALWVIAPRGKFSSLVGRPIRWTPEYKPVSFYDYIASQYGPSDFEKMETDLAGMDNADFAREALEQHFAISRVIHVKSKWVWRATAFTLLAALFVCIALIAKMSGS